MPSSQVKVSSPPLLPQTPDITHSNLASIVQRHLVNYLNLTRIQHLIKSLVIELFNITYKMATHNVYFFSVKTLRIIYNYHFCSYWIICDILQQFVTMSDRPLPLVIFHLSTDIMRSFDFHWCFTPWEATNRNWLVDTR